MLELVNVMSEIEVCKESRGLTAECLKMLKYFIVLALTRFERLSVVYVMHNCKEGKGMVKVIFLRSM